jgi:hypothetical protein
VREGGEGFRLWVLTTRGKAPTRSIADRTRTRVGGPGRRARFVARSAGEIEDAIEEYAAHGVARAPPRRCSGRPARVDLPRYQTSCSSSCRLFSSDDLEKTLHKFAEPSVFPAGIRVHHRVPAAECAARSDGVSESLEAPRSWCPLDSHVLVHGEKLYSIVMQL